MVLCQVCRKIKIWKRSNFRRHLKNNVSQFSWNFSKLCLNEWISDQDVCRDKLVSVSSGPNYFQIPNTKLLPRSYDACGCDRPPRQLSQQCLVISMCWYRFERTRRCYEVRIFTFISCNCVFLPLFYVVIHRWTCLNIIYFCSANLRWTRKQRNTSRENVIAKVSCIPFIGNAVLLFPPVLLLNTNKWFCFSGKLGKQHVPQGSDSVLPAYRQSLYPRHRRTRDKTWPSNGSAAEFTE